MSENARVRWTLLGVMLAMLLAMLDNAVVGTAMPTIVRDLGGVAHLSWVVTAYTLATAVSTPVWGKLGDLRGRRGVFLIAIAVFLAGSVASGAAQTMGQLIGFRALQGLGAGGLAVGAFALIADLVPPRERGRYQGMSSAVMALGTIGGPLVGGFITGHLGWRYAFYINLPLGLLAFAWCRAMLKPAATPRKPGRIDWAGVLLLGGTIATVILAATWAGVRYAWTSPQILGLGALALAGLTTFVLTQRRAADPLLPPRVFAHRNMRLASAIVLIVGAVMFTGALYLPIYQQTVQHASAADSGLLLLPMMIPLVLASQLPGRVMTRTGRYKIFPVLGGAFLTLGAALLATLDASSGRLQTSAFMALVGIGLGLTMQMTTTIAQNSVEMRDIGAATAATTLFRTLGGTVAVAAFGALHARSVLHSGQVGGTAQGVAHIYTAVAVLCALAFAAALFVKEVPLRGKPKPEPAPEPSPGPEAAPEADREPAPTTGVPNGGQAVSAR